MKKQPQNGFIIFVLMITIIIDAMGMGLVFPIIPELLMSKSSIYFSVNTPIEIRNFWYGISMAVWPLGIFLGSALLGRLSDIYGRKKILLIALFGVTISYLLSVLSFQNGYLSIFIFSRLISGFFGGSFGIAQAVILDISPTEQKIKNLGFITLAASIGFIIGPIITTLVGLAMNASEKALEVPFYIGATLALLNLISVWIFLHETYKSRITKYKINIIEIIFSFRIVFTDKRICLLAISFLLLQIGWGFYVQSLSLVLAQVFNFSQTSIGAFFIILSAGFILTTLFLQNLVLKYARPKTVIISASLTIGFILIICSYFLSIYSQSFTAFVSAALEILCYTSLLAWLSEKVSENEQGAVMGGTVSVFGIAWVVNAFLIGLLVNISLLLPFYIAAIFILISGIILIKKRD